MLQLDARTDGHIRFVDRRDTDDIDGCRVLVIEDDPILRFALCALFESEAWIVAVQATATGTAGLKALAEDATDVLVTDARLPDIALGALLERANSISPRTRQIVHSGLGPGELQAVDSSIDGYVQKGRDPLELVRSLHEVYREQQSSRNC